jgi:very-short-patch-repair endonuclease
MRLPDDDKLDFEHEVRSANGLNVTENKLYLAMKSIGLFPVPQFKISRMTVDFAFPNEKLVVEINGPYHNKEEQKIRDQKRWFALKNEGFERKTFDSDRVYNNPDEVADVVKDLLIKYAPPSTIDSIQNNLRNQEEKKRQKILEDMWKRICKK